MRNTGNTELLEATITRLEILPRRRGAQGKAAGKLHQRFPGGTLELFPQVIALGESNTYLGSQLIGVTIAVSCSKAVTRFGAHD